MTIPNSKKTYLGLAILFFVLGVGNIGFSSHKIKYYQNLVEEAQTQKVSHSNGFTADDIQANTSAHEMRIKSRLSYYEFATLGGTFFLALALLFVLASWNTSKYQEFETDEKATT